MGRSEEERGREGREVVRKEGGWEEMEGVRKEGRRKRN